MCCISVVQKCSNIEKTKCCDRARSQTQNQGIFQKRKRLFSRGSEAREINISKAELAAQEWSDKKGSLTADQKLHKGHSKLEVLPNSLTLVFSINLAYGSSATE